MLHVGKRKGISAFSVFLPAYTFYSMPQVILLQAKEGHTELGTPQLRKWDPPHYTPPTSADFPSLIPLLTPFFNPRLTFNPF